MRLIGIKQYYKPLAAASLLVSVSYLDIADAAAQSAPLYPSRTLETAPPRDGIDWQQTTASAPLYPSRGTAVQEATAAAPTTTEFIEPEPIPISRPLPVPLPTVLAKPELKVEPVPAAPAAIATPHTPPRILPLPQPKTAETPDFKPFATIETQAEVPIDPTIHALPTHPGAHRKLPPITPSAPPITVAAKQPLSSPPKPAPLVEAAVTPREPSPVGVATSQPRSLSVPPILQAPTEEPSAPLEIEQPATLKDNKDSSDFTLNKLLDSAEPITAQEEEIAQTQLELPPELPEHPGSYRSNEPLTAPPPLKQQPTEPAVTPEPQQTKQELEFLEELEDIPPLPKRHTMEEPPEFKVSQTRSKTTCCDEPPSQPLSKQSERILSKVPRGVDSPPKQTIRKTSIDRFDPEIEGILNGEAGEEEEEVATHESMGVKIQVRRPALDVNLELKNAYNALIAGQPHVAVQIYKDILRQSPRNQDALFGIATTFHRLNEIDLARPFYGKLLSINPSHRDGLTNFLTLIADESPDDAVQRLQTLMTANPDFSPIPAQLGILYDEMGKPDEAIDVMIRAVRLSPENVAYKYNLAVMYDKYGMVADATILYNQLLEAYRSGIKLPAEAPDIQRRVIHINTNNQG